MRYHDQSHGGPATWFRGRPKIARPDWLAALKALQGAADEKTDIQGAPGSPIETIPATEAPPSGPPSDVTRTPKEVDCVSPRRHLPGEIDLSDDDYDVRWAGMSARTDSPSVDELKAEGWTVEHVDPRYGTHLMKRRKS